MQGIPQAPQSCCSLPLALAINLLRLSISSGSCSLFLVLSPSPFSFLLINQLQMSLLMANLNMRPETRCWETLPQTCSCWECQQLIRDDPAWPLLWPPRCSCVALGPGHRQHCLSGRGWWMERIDGAQPIVLIPNSSIPQREASISPIVTCKCNSPLGRVGAEVLGKNNGFTRQKKSKGWMKHPAEQATPRST